MKPYIFPKQVEFQTENPIVDLWRCLSHSSHVQTYTFALSSCSYTLRPRGSAWGPGGAPPARSSAPLDTNSPHVIPRVATSLDGPQCSSSPGGPTCSLLEHDPIRSTGCTRQDFCSRCCFGVGLFFLGARVKYRLGEVMGFISVRSRSWRKRWSTSRTPQLIMMVGIENRHIDLPPYTCMITIHK